MLVSFASHTVSLQSWPTKPQMLESLSTCDAGTLVLGQDAEQQRAFYSAIVHLGWEGFRTFGIGICSEGHGLVPTILLQSNQERVIIGLNSEVIGIDLPQGNLRFRLLLDSLFMRLLELPRHKLLLIQHEIGIVALAETGEVPWKFSRDIITRLRLSESELLLEFMDSTPARLDLYSGSER